MDFLRGVIIVPCEYVLQKQFLDFHVYPYYRDDLYRSRHTPHHKAQEEDDRLS